MVRALGIPDQQQLLQDFPLLNCSLPRQVIWGSLELDCSFDEGTLEIVYGDEFENYLYDSYEIRIDFNRKDTFGFPKVFEESGIIANFAGEECISLENLHINRDGSCCLGIFPEYQWQNASVFIRDKIIPFFYWQSYRRVKGKEPWPGYKHGDDGIRQAMAMSPELTSKGESRNKPCPCQSGVKYKKCCMERDVILKKSLSKNIAAQR